MRRLILSGYREQVGDFHALAGWRMTLVERRPSAAMYDCLDTDFDLVRIAARMLRANLALVRIAARMVRANLVEVTWEDGQVQLETIVEGVGNPADGNPADGIHAEVRLAEWQRQESAEGVLLKAGQLAE